jgi:hypothetical protein
MNCPVETLELIQQTAKQAQAPVVVESLNTDGRTAYVQQGGEIKQFPLPAKPRDHRVGSLADLILFAQREDNKSPIVWHGVECVVLVTNDADRRDSVTLPLTLSERFKTLQMLAEEKPALTQVEFIRLLRVDLGLDNTAVVAKFRKLDWSNGAEANGDIQHGSAKLGKSIAAKVQGIDALPDELPVEVPVYQQTGERQAYIVQCLIEIDTLNQRFQLIPKADELERVVDLAQAGIHERLNVALNSDAATDANVPVYYGTP